MTKTTPKTIKELHEQVLVDRDRLNLAILKQRDTLLEQVDLFDAKMSGAKAYADTVGSRVMSELHAFISPMRMVVATAIISAVASILSLLISLGVFE